MEYLKQEFAKIKENGRSFLGIDGGDIKSSIWICGLEFGGSQEAMSAYYNSPEIKTYPHAGYDIPYRSDCPETFLNSKYDRFLAVLYNNIFNDQKLLEYDKDVIDRVMKNELYSNKSKIFKLNLYPIAKKNSDFDLNIEKKFQTTKGEYYGAIHEKRSSFFKELLKEFKPKKIICTTLQNGEEMFVDTFFGMGEWISYKKEIVTFKNMDHVEKKFKISQYRNELTTLVIIPFPGMGNGNLNSYLDMINMANHLRNNYL